VLSAVRSAPPALSPRAALGDWDELLSAVTARLRLTVVGGLATTSRGQARDRAGRVQANVMACVAALDRLHAALADEFGRRRRFELDALDVHAALARARAELVGSQDGERRARHLALHDGLTSLPNRTFFRERLDGALAHPEQRRAGLALLYIDLDGFKAINDAHGHAVGDELLGIVAARLTRAVRAEDVVGRLGGDEFACLLEGVLDREQLGQVARKLFDTVSAPLRIGTLELAVRPSIGIALCPADGATADVLLGIADAAMYRAKRQRTGYAFFDRVGDA
jgi:diguanylate cyclase (GGDEF)-like protein